MGCTQVCAVEEGPFKGAESDPEYETIGAFGGQCGVSDFGAIIAANQICDEEGIDTMTTGTLIAFAMECYERGLISKTETAGLDLRFGNAEAMVEMVHRIGKREGLGDVLAEGTKRAAEKIGKGAAKLANHIKGLEMTGYDIRGLKTAAMGYAVSFRGADHNRHGAYTLISKEQLTVSRLKRTERSS